MFHQLLLDSAAVGQLLPGGWAQTWREALAAAVCPKAATAGTSLTTPRSGNRHQMWRYRQIVALWCEVEGE